MKRSSQIVLAVALLLTCITAAGGFTLTGSMTMGRNGHTATLLLDGRVLIAGGDGAAMPPGRTAELYDPASGRFVATHSMVRPRVWHSATLLASGQVLIVGGTDDTSAELYDASTGTFSLTGEMHAPKRWHVATLLTNGNVLIAGDVDAELYDPKTGQFAPAGPYARTLYSLNTATLLPDGRVLFVGDEPARLYDPASNTFGSTGSLGAATGIYGLELHSATLLKNGRVLIAGGANDEVSPAGHVAAAELYDSATGAFSATAAMLSPRDAHAAVLLADGRVLIVGGETGSCAGGVCRFAGSLDSAELYDHSSGTFAAAGNMNTPRSAPQATLLGNGDVLITGGVRYCFEFDCNGKLASAELYHPSSPALSYQGLWWNPRESGWGVHIAHQGNILFATWFTYDFGGAGMWLVMSNGARTASGAYSGELQRTTGPAFSAEPFDPARVTRTTVGDATFTFADADNGTFRYTVNGITQTKAITRLIYSSPR
jgi:hypothetical protein